MINEKDSDALAEWTEHEMSVTAPSRAVLRGTDAAAHGREALERFWGDRPSLDPNARPGQHSRTRQVRLPSEANATLDAVAAAHANDRCKSHARDRFGKNSCCLRPSRHFR